MLVADEAGQPVAGRTVAIWSEDQIRQGGDTDGRMVQQNLLKGNYRVEAAGAEAVTCHVRAERLNRCDLVVTGGH